MTYLMLLSDGILTQSPPVNSVFIRHQSHFYRLHVISTMAITQHALVQSFNTNLRNGLLVCRILLLQFRRYCRCMYGPDLVF